MKDPFKNLIGNKVAFYGVASLIAGGIIYKTLQNGVKKYTVNPERARKTGAY